MSTTEPTRPPSAQATGKPSPAAQITEGDMQLARIVLFDVNNLQANGQSDLAAALIARALATSRTTGEGKTRGVMRILWLVVRGLPDHQTHVDPMKFHPSAQLKITDAPSVGASAQFIEARLLTPEARAELRKAQQ